MNYSVIYQRLIEYRKQNPIKDYTEKHHIIPKCVDGTNKNSNLVRLTAREHFVAHQLLAKIYKTKGLIYAAYKMSNFKTYGSKKYAWLKELHGLTMLGNQYSRNPSKETRKKMSECKKGKSTWIKDKYHTEESKRKCLNQNQQNIKKIYQKVKKEL
jgi:hypothetical protein